MSEFDAKLIERINEIEFRIYSLKKSLRTSHDGCICNEKFLCGWHAKVQRKSRQRTKLAA